MTNGHKGKTAWRTVDAVDTSCHILESLRESGGAGVTELANELDVSKAGIHSHLATLREHELVTKNGDKYRLSLRFLDYGQFAKESFEFYDIVKDELDTLAEETGEVTHFMVEEHGWGIYIYKARASSAVQTASYVGDRKHMHCTGVGKAILSNLPKERVDAIIDRRGMPQQTENTLTDREELFDELDTIRERGVAFDDEEILEGLRCVAVPVSSREQGLLGAISVAGPTSRMKEQRFRENLPEVLVDAANVIQINVTGQT